MRLLVSRADDRAGRRPYSAVVLPTRRNAGALDTIPSPLLCTRARLAHHQPTPRPTYTSSQHSQRARPLARTDRKVVEVRAEDAVVVAAAEHDHDAAARLLDHGRVAMTRTRHVAVLAVRRYERHEGVRLAAATALRHRADVASVACASERANEARRLDRDLDLELICLVVLWRWW